MVWGICSYNTRNYLINNQQPIYQPIKQQLIKDSTNLELSTPTHDFNRGSWKSWDVHCKCKPDKIIWGICPNFPQQENEYFFFINCTNDEISSLYSIITVCYQYMHILKLPICKIGKVVHFLSWWSLRCFRFKLFHIFEFKYVFPLV